MASRAAGGDAREAGSGPGQGGAPPKSPTSGVATGGVEWAFEYKDPVARTA
jgi:hypothetical protein